MKNFLLNKCITIPDTFKVRSDLISEQEETINSKLDEFSLNVLKKVNWFLTKTYLHGGFEFFDKQQ